MALTKITNNLIAGASLSAAEYGAAGDGSTDDTLKIQAAIDAAFAGGGGAIMLNDGVHIIRGTLYLKPGVILYGNNPVGDYYPGFPMAHGATLYKPNDGLSTAGPVVEMQSASCLLGVCVKNYLLAGSITGTVRFGAMDLTTDCVDAAVINCHILALRTGDLSGATTSRGIFFPKSQSGHARYFNRVSNVTINDCDIAIGLENQSNANNFTNIITRECHVHYQINGYPGEAIENQFTGLGLFTMGTLTPAAVGFQLDYCSRNNFISYNTELYGTAYNIGSNATLNVFQGVINEVTPSTVGPNNRDVTSWDAGFNVNQVERMILPTRSTGDKYTFVPATKFSRFARVSGTLPNLNINSGTLTAGAAGNRIIARFGATNFAKAQKPTFHCRLKVFANGPFGTAQSVADVEFLYRCTNTTSGAAQLSVLKANKKGDYLTGLYFISSVSTPANGFAIALVGGNYGAYAFDSITVSIEAESLTYDTNVRFWGDLSAVTFASEAVTAADVTDATSLLTVADTTI